MPELPEVETIVRELRTALPDRQVRRVQVFRTDALGRAAPGHFIAGMEGRRFGPVRRRGKFLLFDLQPAGCLVAHLRMTGKFILSPPLRAPQEHDRVWFHLDDGRLLIFQDMRCFGTLALVERPEQWPGVAKLGVDPYARQFTRAWLARHLAQSRTPLKHWLMDQTRIAGLGNIYASEVLFQARLSPLRRADRVTEPEAHRLHRAIRRVLDHAIRKNGTTISDYRRVDQKSGEFQRYLKVYGREGKPCAACRAPVERIRQQQRSTFFCPECQS